MHDVLQSLGLIQEALETSPIEPSTAGRILVVMVPAFNEAATVGDVIRRVPRRIPGVDRVKVLVVDDGSDDGTGEEALQAGADRVVRHPRNLGLGVAFRDGLDQALALGADIIVNMDADDQHEPAEIPWLIEPILDDTADVVLGHRDLAPSGGVPRSKRIGNRIATFAIRRATRLPILDGQAGFRALSREAALRLHLQEDYTFTHEMLFQVAENHLRIRHVPVTVKARNGNSRLIPTIWKYARREAGILLRGYVRYRPLRLFGALALAVAFVASLLALRLQLSTLSGGPTAGTVFEQAALATLLLCAFTSALVAVLAEAKRADRSLQEEILYRLKKATLGREGSREREIGPT